MSKYIQQNAKIIKSLEASVDRLSMETINYFRETYKTVIHNNPGETANLWHNDCDQTKLPSPHGETIPTKIYLDETKGEVVMKVVFKSGMITRIENLPYYGKSYIAQLLIEKFLSK